ncbi:MAG TPA: 2Fe-2S iron-sulfur cluster-binding protein [Candidatus Kapabacteria bacterium]|nr:2Fe-2S iron-sulfur cluster-binding protein [Candidatus Kapabacteria bacterium]
MPKITIDGKEFEAEAGKTVIQVALEHGMEIPHFCWHPALSVAGNCRMCLVEVEKMPKLQIACATPVSEGMVVKTMSDVAVKGREDVMEFLLINHPLDCPICDEAGQCKLQDYAYDHSRGESRFVEEKSHKEKRVPFGPNVLFDGERCISCSRCVRFADEIADQPVLTFVDRGDHNSIRAIPEMGWDNINSMNVIDICPVGALTSRDFRFKARVWDMSFTDTVCTACSRNCSIRSGVRNNEVLRLEPRTNMNVNEYWMCDHGRLNAYPHINAPERIEKAWVKNAGFHEQVSWEEGARTAAERLKRFKHDEVLFIGSGNVPVEDNYLFARFAKERFHQKNVRFIQYFEGQDDRLVLRAEKTPNARGLQAIGLKADPLVVGEHSAKELLAELTSGRIKAVWALEDNFLEDEQIAEAFKNIQFFVCHATNESKTTAQADVVFGASTWAEREGVLVNFAGWTQKLRPAVTTAHQVRGLDHLNMSRLDRFGTPYDKWATKNKRDVYESWRIIQMVADHMGAHYKYHYTEDIFDEIATSVGDFAGMDYEKIGEQGLPVAGLKQDAKPVMYRETYQDATERLEGVGSLIL